MFIQCFFWGEVCVVTRCFCTLGQTAHARLLTEPPPCPRAQLFITPFVRRAAAQAVYLSGQKKKKRKTTGEGEGIYFCELQQQQTIATGGFLEPAQGAHSQGRKFPRAVPLSLLPFLCSGGDGGGCGRGETWVMCREMGSFLLSGTGFREGTGADAAPVRIVLPGLQAKQGFGGEVPREPLEMCRDRCLEHFTCI